MVQCHHERFNGSGYPSGLKGKQIPISARIAAIVDSYDSMISERPYKKAVPVDFRHLEQWQCEMGVKRPVTSKRTPPHRQPPVAMACPPGFGVPTIISRRSRPIPLRTSH